jgi:cell division transport system permease protein
MSMTTLQRAWRGGRSDWRLHLLSVFSVAVAFVCMAAALLLVVNVRDLQQRWSSLGRMSVYLAPNTQAAQTAPIEEALRQTGGVKAVRFISSAQARTELRDLSADPVLGQLPADAFPASLEVDLEQNVPIERIVAVKGQLEQLPTVEAVETYGSWSERVGRLLSGGVTAALLLALVVLGAVVSVVSSTMRLVLQRRRIEVEILKLVGATNQYVRRPFVVEGAVQGALGAALALLFMGGLFALLSASFDNQLATLLGVRPHFLPLSVSLAMVAAGTLLGALAAFASLRKLLTV